MQTPGFVQPVMASSRPLLWLLFSIHDGFSSPIMASHNPSSFMASGHPLWLLVTQYGFSSSIMASGHPLWLLVWVLVIHYGFSSPIMASRHPLWLLPTIMASSRPSWLLPGFHSCSVTWFFLSRSHCVCVCVSVNAIVTFATSVWPSRRVLFCHLRGYWCLWQWISANYCLIFSWGLQHWGSMRQQPSLVHQFIGRRGTTLSCSSVYREEGDNPLLFISL